LKNRYFKDASATAIYGSRGAKGVVIVTTKRGKSGKTIISYDAYTGIRAPRHLPQMFSGSEYVAYRTEMFKAQGKDISRNNTLFLHQNNGRILMKENILIGLHSY